MSETGSVTTMMGEAGWTIHDTVGASHAAIPGHFPNHPVVPAVVILERVSCAAARAYRDATITHIEHVKFLQVLRPGETFEIVVSVDDSVVSFQCVSSAGSVFAVGKLRAEVKAA